MSGPHGLYNMNLDGPSDTRSSHGGSQSGSQHPGSNKGSPPSQGGSQAGPARSRSGSQPKPPSGPVGYPAPLGFDPAKPEGVDNEEMFNKNIDLPAEAYVTAQGMKNAGIQAFARRPAYNPSTRFVPLEVNQFRIMKWNDKADIIQYDITLSPVPSKPIVFKKVWKHPKVQEALAQSGCKWLYDGRKLAWAPILIPRGEMRLTVDLDYDRPPRRDGTARPNNNTFYFIIRKSRNIRLAALEAYLKGSMDWDNSILECLNFMDHLMRQGPSEKLLMLKRCFYREDYMKSGIRQLDSVVECIKGVYASVRLNQSILSNIGRGLGLNVDVANTAFWIGGQQMAIFIRHFLTMNDPQRWGRHELNSLAPEFLPVRYVTKEGLRTWAMSDAFKQLRRMQKLKFTVTHRGPNAPKSKVYAIKKFEFGEVYGPDGANSKKCFIPKPGGGEISIYDYFVERYGFRDPYPGWPMVVTERDGLFPIGACKMLEMQLYRTKLNPIQTANMIKFAVTRPTERKKDIMEAKASLDYGNDPYLKQYGIEIDNNMARTQGVLLEPPVVQYNGSFADPGTSGRWDLRGKKFLQSNPTPLTSWGVLILEQSVQPPQAEAFAAQFKQIYTGHGGRISSNAVIIDQRNERNMGKALEIAYNTLLKKQPDSPVMLIFCILKVNNSGTYERIKKSADCRFAILTQCCLAKHVIKNSAQYHSNVAMKVNSKLGGTTCRVPPANKNPTQPAFFKEPTMIIGADVSHSTPGINAPSMACMTMSMDKDAAKYAATCDTNGYRVEMLSPINTRAFLNRLLPAWFQNLRSADPPRHIYYFRDGVSEGQFAQVLEHEVMEMKTYFRIKFNNKVPKFTVIVATKRHHIRMFPAPGKGDKNGNCLPGTLLEKDVTHPYQWDFYLCSHSAIQGTARPVHYHVLLDEANLQPAALQKMIYHQCYQYARSTTPVSLHPAIYYADLASGRSRCHENVATSEVFRSGPKAAELVPDFALAGISMGPPSKDTESTPLLPLGGEKDSTEAHRNFFRTTMWFI